MAVSLTRHSDNFKRYVYDSFPADALGTTDPVSTADLNTGTIQVVHSGHTAGTSTWELQSTLDGSNWDTVTGTSNNTAGAAGSKTIILDPLPGGQCRIKVTAANGTAGAAYLIYLEGRKGGN